MQVAVEVAQTRPGHARFIGLNQRIIGMLPISDGGSDLALHFERPLQVRRKGSKIVLSTRPAPGALRHRLELGRRTDERCGDTRKNRGRRRCLLHRLTTRVMRIASGQFSPCILDRPL